MPTLRDTHVSVEGDSDCQNTITNVVLIVCCPNRDRSVPNGEGRPGRKTLVHYDGRRSIAVIACRNGVADCLTTWRRGLNLDCVWEGVAVDLGYRVGGVIEDGGTDDRRVQSAEGLRI